MDRREYFRQYYAKNKEKLKARSKEWYVQNSGAALHLERVRNSKRTPEEIKRDNQYYKKWYAEHREAQLAKAREEYAANPEPAKRKVRRYRKFLPEDKLAQIGRRSLLGNFHTTEEWYNAKLAEQDGHCALCSREREENCNRLAIDHNHECCPKSGSCGKCLRGILCRRCNLRLGNLDEFLSLGMVIGNGHSGWFERAMQYLKQYKLRLNREMKC